MYIERRNANHESLIQIYKQCYIGGRTKPFWDSGSHIGNHWLERSRLPKGW